jgi:glutamate carboxypeptidase
LQAFDLTILEELVNINSQTYNVSGVKLAQRLIADHLKDLGMTIRWHRNYEMESADAMVATYGEGPIVVTLLGHTDTVAKGGESFPFQRDENGIITGAGIADMKAGMAIIVDSLTGILPMLSDELTLQVVLSPNEEIGSTGFRHLFTELGKNSNLVLCFEPALEDGSFIHIDGMTSLLSMRE